MHFGFSPVMLLSHELQGSEKVWKNTLALQALEADHLHCASGSVFARHVTKLAVLCHCVEEDPNKSLFQGQPVVPAHGIGAAGAHCRENKDSEQSLLCLQCAKGASEGTSCFQQVFQICCNPGKAKPPHRGGVSAVFPWCSFCSFPSVLLSFLSPGASFPSWQMRTWLQCTYLWPRFFKVSH